MDSEVIGIIRHLEPWIWAYSGVLIILFAAGLIAMLGQYLSIRKRGREAEEGLRPVPLLAGLDARRGLSSEHFDGIVVAASRLRDRGAQWWPAVRGAVERYTNPESTAGEKLDAYFLTQRAHELISVEQVSAGFSFSLFRAFPGILTSLGLLGTFVALLLGLAGLTPTATGEYDLHILIGNLSGKFVTSILALALSVLFVLAEICAQAALRRVRDRIVSAVSDRIPYLSAERVLLDIHREGVRQSTAVRNISSDIVDKFASVFRDDLSGQFAAVLSGSVATQFHAELGPTLESLTGTMKSLSETVAGIEAQKQDSIVGQIERLTTSLERSLSTAMADMGRQFRDALTGSTKDEFGALADVVKGSASMLSDMNAGFASLHAVLQGLVEEARSSTSAQMREGVEQAERLNQLMEGLMTRISAAAGESQQQVTSLLTGVVTDLSKRVGVLSTDLVQAVITATAQSQQSVSDTVRRASDWSSQTGQQLHDLMTTLAAKSADFERGSEALMAAQAALQSTLEQNRSALSAMNDAAEHVSMYSTALAGLQKQLNDSQRVHVELSTASTESVRKLVEASARHDEFLGRYQQTFERYRSVFEGVDAEIAQVLDTIVDKLQAYNQGVEQNFKTIVTSASDLMPRMAGVLKQSAEDLHEQLDELSDVLDKGIAAIGQRSKPAN